MPVDVPAKLDQIQRNSAETVVIRCALTFDQVRDLAEALKDNTALLELNLGGADIGDDGMKHLLNLWDQEKWERERAAAKAKEKEEGEIVREKDKEKAEQEKFKMAIEQITTLELYRNNLGISGAEALAKAFSWGAMPALRQLFLSNNQMGDEGAQALATAFAGGAVKQLHMLDLYCNRIGDVGVEALTIACADGALPVLQKIMLDYKCITPSIKEDLENALADTSGAKVLWG